MRLFHRLLSMTLVATMSLSIMACGSDSDNSSENQSDPGEEAEQDSEDDSSNSDSSTGNKTLPNDYEFESAYDFRFSSLQFTDDSPGSNLNSVLSAFFDQGRKYPVVILIELEQVDAEAGTLQVRGGGGKKSDLECQPDPECEYTWEAESKPPLSEASLDAESGELEGSLEQLDFTATMSTGAEPTEIVIPVKDIEFSGKMAQSSSGRIEIVNGQLEGIVKKSDADDVQIAFPGGEPFPLTQALKESELNEDLDGDGQNDAWRVNTTFSAVQTTIVN